MKPSKIFLLFFIPIILIFVCKRVENNRGHFWIDPDPDYCYLLNGLSLASKNGDIGHIDHPGTPVQIVSGEVIKVIYRFRKTSNDIITDVLLNPEQYLKNIAWFFAIFNISLIFFLGLVVLIFTRSLFYSILFQGIPFTSKMLLLQGFYNVTPEPFLLSANLIFIGICISLLYDYPHFKYPDNNKYGLIRFIKKNYWPMLFGFVIAFSVASKLYSAPLFIIPFFLLDSRLNRIKYILFTFLFFVVFTFPIIEKYNTLLSWIIRLVSHKGYYGHGEAGLVDWPSFFQAIKKIYSNHQFIAGIFILSITALIIRLVKRDKGLKVKMMMAFIIFQIFEISLIAKEYYPHYVVPVLPSFTFTFFLSIFMFDFNFNYKKILISLFIISNLFIVSSQLKYLFKKNNVKQNVQNQSDSNLKECIEIYSYGCSSPVYALDLGNYYSKRIFCTQLSEIYSDKYFYDIWNRRFYDWKGDTVFLDSLYMHNHNLILKGRKNILKEYQQDFFSMKFINKDINDNFLISPKKVSVR